MGINRRQFTTAGLSVAGLAAISGPAALAQSSGLLHKAIPSSGEKIPVVGLGTNRYGVGTSADVRAPLKAALARFHALGGTVIDTAPGYRTSESVLGDLIGELGIRSELFMATKTDKSGGRKENAAQIADSLRKLKSESVDLMQVHNLNGWQNALPLMRELKEEGRIRYVGITTSRADQYKEFEKAMLAETLDFVQLNYSLEQRESAERLMPLAADRGVAVMINRAFGGGRLFNRVDDQLLPDWAREFDCASWAQFLLKYAISHPASTVVIPGMTKVHHVDDNFGAARGRLPNTAERAMMEAFFDNL
ncbi:MAG: aldo/keto reductase [Woeseiaceae bacterium]|nr:aldo/keto reductase [Woeseiaceae bacterium]